MTRLRSAALILVLLLFGVVHAQESPAALFSWLDADLALSLPSAWNVSTSSEPMQIRAEDGDRRLTVTVLPETTTTASFYDRLFALVVETGLSPQSWTQPSWFGRSGGRIETTRGIGMIGRLPDDRVIAIVCGCTSAEFDDLVASVQFSASALAEDGRVYPDTPVQGTLTAERTEETWLYSGIAGEVITIAAVDLARPSPTALGLDMEIILYAPDGSELTRNDDHGGLDLYGVYDAQIRDLTLPDSGDYRIVVRSVQNTSGTYTLGISAPRLIALDPGGVTRVTGRIQAVFPRQKWQFEAAEGQALTITMLATSGTLDTLLDLTSPSGRRTAYNDDASDPALGVNAQIVRVQLPRDGIYTLDATRYEGTGSYELIIASL
jgi:hypothetical protein